MISADITSTVEEFKAAFARYMEYTRKTPDEALEKKAKNINIRVAKYYQERQFGGLPRKKGIAKSEAMARFAAGQGILVRPSLMAEYRAAKAGMNGKDATGLWQSYVMKEIAKRSQGVGFLGASFLAYRKRSEGQLGQVFAVNQGGRGIGFIDKQKTLNGGKMTIASLADGSGTVNERYGIIAAAIADETFEFTQWMDAKDADNKRKAGLN